MKISELAAHTGLSIDTIRFYEKIGLLDAAHYARRANGYRDYFQTAVERLELVKNARLSGFTLAEMVTAIQAWESGEYTLAEKEAIMLQKMQEVDDRIAQLNRIKAYLREKIANMREMAEEQPEAVAE